MSDAILLSRKYKKDEDASERIKKLDRARASRSISEDEDTESSELYTPEQ